MSLGFIQGGGGGNRERAIAEQRRRPPVAPQTATLSISSVDVGVKTSSPLRMCLSTMCLKGPYSLVSALSTCSIFSFDSTVSIACVFAVICLFSVTSIGSVASFASIGSLVSAASYGSVLSVGSHGCVGGIFEDCTKKVTHPIEMRVELHLTESIYDLMTSCTKSAYQEDPRPEQCDYQDATCVFINMTSGTNETRSCEARRKGHASWREMWHKSSFKLKKFKSTSDGEDEVHFGTFPCGGEGGELCPDGETSNVWETKKVTLNNQIQGDGEIDAYAAFRRIAPAALAVQTHLQIFRGDVLQTSDMYVLLETIDDKEFTRKWFGGDTVLYESESAGVEFERFDGDIMENQDEDDDVVEAALKAPANLARVKALTLSDYDINSVASHFAGESFTNHWDGACHPNNHYVLYNSSTHYLISSGMDQTYQCRPSIFFPYKGDVDRVYNYKSCGVGYECIHSSATCRRLYETHLAKLKMTPGLRRIDCPDWVLYVVLSMVIGTLLPLMVLLALRRYT